MLTADPSLTEKPSPSRDTPGPAPRRLAPYSSPVTASAAESKQEILSMRSQGGFVLVPHYPSLMRSPEPLPDPQSLPETADHCFLRGQLPHIILSDSKSYELSLKSHVVPATPREDSTPLSGPKDSSPAFRPTDTEVPQVALQNSVWTATLLGST